ncbi:hypothetical protein GJ744_003405 [Endocarpon pusillum]|uniref:Uncharacterized protein n=1 Tax=Endocarpon pusillum TaxID=364733 RepID=A0A8H7AAS1_9EURO|nr:hypothetical protein GJ744_003405 [Endocarpon pusillum]
MTAQKRKFARDDDEATDVNTSSRRQKGQSSSMAAGRPTPDSGLGKEPVKERPPQVTASDEKFGTTECRPRQAESGKY